MYAGGINLTFQFSPGTLTKEFISEVSRTLLEACRGGWETGFISEWTSPARDLTIYVGVHFGANTGARSIPLGPLLRARL